MATSLRSALSQLSPRHEQYAVAAVDLILCEARQAGASDIHLLPSAGGRAELFWRIDGLLQPVASFEQASANIVARLKVLADLLTYRTDVPQEGRIRTGTDETEMRVSTFPTVHGEKAVVRLFVGSGQYRTVPDLGLPEDVARDLMLALNGTSGVIIAAGPAGAGKTTTLYACLRTILQASPHSKSISTLEDPVEALIPGVAQTQLAQGRELTYARGLASLMRQDPEVILVGEIRDRPTAETVFQASLTGQLVLTSFHAGSAVGAIGRLLDMDIEPYVLRSGLRAVLAQRLLRRLCTCAKPVGSAATPATNPQWLEPVGCDRCRQTGYSGRFVVAEMLLPESSASGRQLLDRIDSQSMQELAIAAGMVPFQQRIRTALDQGHTSCAEAWRVFAALTPDERPLPEPSRTDGNNTISSRTPIE